MFSQAADPDARDRAIGAWLSRELSPSDVEVVLQRDRVLASLERRIQRRSGGHALRVRRLALAGLVGVVAVAAAVLVLPQQNKTMPVRLIDGSWAYRYGSVSEMAHDADLVAVVQVERVVRQGADPQSPDLPQTRFALGVERVLRGSAGTTIDVVQTGGPMTGELVEVRDDPLMTVGTHYLLFLRQLAPDGAYAVVGGPQGRFVVNERGGLTPLPEGLTLPSNATVDTVADELCRDRVCTIR